MVIRTTIIKSEILAKVLWYLVERESHVEILGPRGATAQVGHRQTLGVTIVIHCERQQQQQQQHQHRQTLDVMIDDNTFQ